MLNTKKRYFFTCAIPNSDVSRMQDCLHRDCTACENEALCEHCEWKDKCTRADTKKKCQFDTSYQKIRSKSVKTIQDFSKYISGSENCSATGTGSSCGCSKSGAATRSCDAGTPSAARRGATEFP